MQNKETKSSIFNQINEKLDEISNEDFQGAIELIKSHLDDVSGGSASSERRTAARFNSSL
jgi:hypothetical protein